MKSKIIIRIAKWKDRQGIKEVNEKCLPVHYTLDEWVEMLSWKNSFVLYSGNQVLGYLIGNKINDNESVIISFAILEEYRGKGWGKKIIQEYINFMKTKKVNKIVLRVKVNNPGAIHLYESVGFKNVKLLKDYYARDDHGYAMELTL